MKPRIRKGVFYFPEYEDAQAHAVRDGWPTNRIVYYELGWAIQMEASGNYVGPSSLADRRRAETPS